MGIVTFDDCYILASQSLESGDSRSCPQQGYAGSLGHIPHSIVCLDRRFRVISEACADEYSMGDLHDVIIHQGELFVVDTLGNRVVAFAITERAVQGSLPLGARYIHPVREWVDPVADEPDASHVNSICVFNGRLYVSVFGRFRSYRGYHTRAESGHILDITDGFRPFGSRAAIPAPPVVRAGLADPHTLVSYQGSLFVIESRTKRVLRDWRPILVLGSGYVRGLLHQREGMWVGLSDSRHSLDEPVGCRAVLLDDDGATLVRSIDLPAREVYAFAKALGTEGF